MENTLWIQTCIPPIFRESTSQVGGKEGLCREPFKLAPANTILSAFVTHHYFDKLLQILWLKATQMYFFSYSSGGQKSYSQNAYRAALLLEDLGENLFPCLFQLPEVFTFPSLWPFTPSSEHITATSASIITSPFLTLTHLSPSYKDPGDGDFPGGPLVKNPPCNVGDVGLIPG